MTLKETFLTTVATALGTKQTSADVRKMITTKKAEMNDAMDKHKEIKKQLLPIDASEDEQAGRSYCERQNPTNGGWSPWWRNPADRCK